jgi:hypothetical protein
MKKFSLDMFDWYRSLLYSLKSYSPFIIAPASRRFSNVHGHRKDRVPHEGKETLVLVESRRPLRGVFESDIHTRRVFSSSSDQAPSLMPMTG